MAADFDMSKLSFGNVEGYRSNDDSISFKIIVLKQLQKISQNANVEFRGGYWQQKVIPLQGGGEKITEEYIQDTREVYSNSIEFLHDLILPYIIKEDSKQMKKPREEMIKASKEYTAAINKLLKDYKKDGKFTADEKVMFREQRVILCRELFQYISIYLEAEKYFGERSN